MTPRKKLIEVALPLEAINAASAREKSIRHGHPSTLHLWWARRPLAACRAVLFAQLVDDPSSWPERFPTEETQGAERKRLHDFIGGTKGADYKDGLVAWENSTNERVLNKARWYIARSLAWGRGEEPPNEDDPEAVCRYLLDHAPPVYDPFCGGGSIPLEAQRLGLRAYGSDLNPVAVMISKALVEFPPKFAGLPPINPDSRKRLASGGAWNAKRAQGLAEDIRYYGNWMRGEAYKRIGYLYPDVELPDGSKATVIAWLWARTVTCPNPACRRYMPLLTSFVLSSRKGNEHYLTPATDSGQLRFKISRTAPSGFGDPKRGLKRGMSGIFECVFCGTVTERDYVAAEGEAGRLGLVQTAVVVEGRRGRLYLEPEHSQLPLDIPAADRGGLEAELGPNPRDLWCRNFGLKTLADLFSPRQLAALTTFSDLVLEARAKALEDGRIAGLDPDPTSLAHGGTGAQAYADALAVYLAFAVNRVVDRHTTIATWDSSPSKLQLRNTFARQAIPMTWDYAEGNPFSMSSGTWTPSIEWVAKAIESCPTYITGHAYISDAASNRWDQQIIISTDDNIGYADLSDFFYVWLRRVLRDVFPAEFSTVLVPKAHELVAIPYRFSGRKEEAEAFFLNRMRRALQSMSQASIADVPVALYYAFKQAEVETEGVVSTGWATFLDAVLSAGFQVDGTWPVRTELGNRMIGRGTNALASSIVLVCCKRSEDAPSVTRGEFLRALRTELPASLHTLQESAIAPVDMAQASIGPGMAVFSRYREVLESDDRPMSVREALRIINAELDEYLARQEGDYDSWTRFAVTWFQQHQFDVGRYGEAETLAKARDVAVQGVVEAGILEAKAGKVRLLRREELPDDYLPFRDSRQTVWEGCQHLIKRLNGQGEEGAARLAKQLGYQADMARDLAYRLYQICERNKWAEEARAYNGLIESWREIIKIRDTLSDETAPGPAQAELAV